MANYIVVIAIISAFIWYDLIIAFGRILGIGKFIDLVERYRRRGVERIFVLFRAYCGFRLEFENFSGEDLPERFLLIGNHQSLLDIPVAMELFPTRSLRFVAKRELGTGVPLVSSVLRYQGHALINRKGNAKGAMIAIVRFARRCRAEKNCPVIFPEGTRSKDGELGAFHTAGVRKILEVDPLPIAVAVFEGGWRIARVSDIFRNLKGARYRMRIVAILPVPEGKKDTLTMIERSRELIDQGLKAMRS